MEGAAAPGPPARAPRRRLRLPLQRRLRPLAPEEEKTARARGPRAAAATRSPPPRCRGSRCLLLPLRLLLLLLRHELLLLLLLRHKLLLLPLRRGTWAPRPTPSSSEGTTTARARWRGRTASSRTAPRPRRGRGAFGEEGRKKRGRKKGKKRREDTTKTTRPRASLLFNLYNYKTCSVPFFSSFQRGEKNIVIVSNRFVVTFESVVRGVPKNEKGRGGKTTDDKATSLFLAQSRFFSSPCPKVSPLGLFCRRSYLREQKRPCASGMDRTKIEST